MAGIMLSVYIIFWGEAKAYDIIITSDKMLLKCNPHMVYHT